MVGARGFEPPTPTTPLWCATRLRYAPTLFQTVKPVLTLSRARGLFRASCPLPCGRSGCLPAILVEPPTPTTPLWCATRLRYAPTGFQTVKPILHPLAGERMIPGVLSPGSDPLSVRKGCAFYPKREQATIPVAEVFYRTASAGGGTEAEGMCRVTAGFQSRLRISSTSSSSTITWRMICWLRWASVRASSPSRIWRAPLMV